MTTSAEEQFPEYHQCALDLLETLAAYMPDLLKKEPFFHAAFSSKNSGPNRTGSLWETAGRGGFKNRSP